MTDAPWTLDDNTIAAGETDTYWWHEKSWIEQEEGAEPTRVYLFEATGKLSGISFREKSLDPERIATVKAEALPDFEGFVERAMQEYLEEIAE